MDQNIKAIKEIETQIEDTLWSLERQDQIEEAFLVYQQAETMLGDL